MSEPLRPVQCITTLLSEWAAAEIRLRGALGAQDAADLGALATFAAKLAEGVHASA